MLPIIKSIGRNRDNAVRGPEWVQKKKKKRNPPALDQLLEHVKKGGNPSPRINDI